LPAFESTHHNKGNCASARGRRLAATMLLALSLRRAAPIEASPAGPELIIARTALFGSARSTGH